MARDEHVDLLKQGVAAWNEWRLKNPDTRPDLSEYRALHRVRLDIETLLRERLG
jgi:hypothetical protein